MTMFGSQWLANAGSGYEISQSIRFNDDDSPKLSRTPSAGNRTTWTYSVWLKRGDIPGLSKDIFSASTNSTNRFEIQFNASEQIRISQSDSGSTTDDLQTNRLFRDPSAWYHIVVRYDTTESTASDRIKLYVNGVQETSFSTANYPTASYEGDVNANVVHTISSRESGGVFFDGYMAEINFVSGTAKVASDFGETNDDGVWIPKRYSGAYGTNGFYLTGANSSDFGEDFSGNNNDWTASGLAAADQMSDTPTNNHCTYNPLRIRGTNTLSDGNLQAAAGSAGAYVTSTFGVSSGKWYWEYTFTGTYNFPIVGIMGTALYQDAYPSQLTNAVLYYSSNGNKYIDSTSSSYGASYAVSDKIGVALNLDDNEITFFKNNSTQGAISISNREYTPLVGEEGSSNGGIIANFGQSDFEYTPPTGFKALNTANLPELTIKDGSAYFHTQLYTGNGSSGLAVTNDANAGDFKPDLWYLAPRSNGDNHVFIDSVRGVTQRLKSNSSDAEDTDSPAQITFETDGFDLDTTDGNFNGSGRTYVAWQWKTTGGSSSTNETGDITSTVSANTTAGFSVLTYSGNGSDNQEIGHGIGIAPKMIITKRRNAGGDWSMYHDAVGINKVMYLNLSNLPASNTEQYRATPTSSVYTVGVGGDVNASGGTYVAYVFSEVEGFSKMGSYVANASTDGPFVHCGFRPAFVIFFSIAGSGAGRWMLDTARSPFNVADKIIQANTSASEDSGSSYNLDFVSNGFKIRTSSDFNSSGRTIAFAAFAENPFGGDDAAPATAR